MLHGRILLVAAMLLPLPALGKVFSYSCRLDDGEVRDTSIAIDTARQTVNGRFRDSLNVTRQEFRWTAKAGVQENGVNYPALFVASLNRSTGAYSLVLMADKGEAGWTEVKEVKGHCTSNAP